MNESWFFGNSGLDKIKGINNSFKSKTVKYINSKCNGDSTIYSPWMSNIENAHFLNDNIRPDEFIVKSNNSLLAISKFYSSPEDLENKISFSHLSEDQYFLLDKSIQIVQEQNNDISVLFKELIKNIVPLKVEQGDFQDLGIGFSTHFAKGAIFLSIPYLENESPLQLAINIAHEVGHQSLYIYQTADPIIEDGMSTEVYSYVRKTERPAIQSFHATVALAFMVRFLMQVNPVESLYFRKALDGLKRDFVKSLDSYDAIQFTELGSLLLEDLRRYAKEI